MKVSMVLNFTPKISFFIWFPLNIESRLLSCIWRITADSQNVLVQKRLELRRLHISDKRKIVRHGYLSGLLGNNYDYSITLLCHTYRRSVTSTEAGIKVNALCQWKKASCSKYLLSRNNNRTVVKRRSVEEQVSDQKIVYVGINNNARFNDLWKTNGSLNDYKRTRRLSGKLTDSGTNIIDCNDVLLLLSLLAFCSFSYLS